MILDNGVCKIYRKTNTAGPAEKPVFQNTLIHFSWYAELNFETSQARPTEKREEIQIDARIRILQNRGINNHDTVELYGIAPVPVMYEVLRAYHGKDDESGELITDLTLRRVTP